MVYLLASLRMFVYCTVYGDGIHFRRPPAHPPHHHGNLFPPLHLLSTVRYCKFLPSCSFDCPSPLLTPPPPSPWPFFLESLIRSWIWQACGFLQRRCMWLWQKTFTQKLHKHNTHPHTHSHIQAQTRHLFKHMDHMQLCECKKKIWELIGEKMYGLG